jgi:hypothetical protein
MDSSTLSATPYHKDTKKRAGIPARFFVTSKKKQEISAYHHLVAVVATAYNIDALELYLLPIT